MLVVILTSLGIGEMLQRKSRGAEESKEKGEKGEQREIQTRAKTLVETSPRDSREEVALSQVTHLYHPSYNEMRAYRSCFARKEVSFASLIRKETHFYRGIC